MLRIRSVLKVLVLYLFSSSRVWFLIRLLMMS
jgi:hypothetical protein